jgi:hypothetical protein
MLICTVLFCLAETVDLSGKWKGSIQTDAGSDYPFTYNFKADGNKLSGEVQTPVGNLPICDGYIKGDSIIFNVNYGGTQILNKGKCYADSIAITVALGDIKYHTLLRRDK